ncbi:MAG: glycosyltransferase family 4 protein [Pyrinomonadaceae bacterium]
MKVLALASYPIQAAATRYRLHQFVEPLSERGVTLTIRPFLNSRLFASLYERSAMPRTALGLVKAGFLRSRDVLAARRADVILVQREAMIFGPPLIEWLSSRVIKRPLVLDLDDATYLPYTGPTYGRLGKALKWFSKTDDLIRWASIVTCGNRTIADYVASKGTKTRVIPTVVDENRFCPVARSVGSATPVVGWIGTHSTFPYLKSIFPVLSALAGEYRYRLKVVGAGRSEIRIPGVDVENLDWRLDREVEDFQSFDIGLYPIDPSLYAADWAAGKSGFKAIQYMAVGIPYVATPVGAVKEIGEVGKTHFCATDPSEWRSALSLLLGDPERRVKMGAAGRKFATTHYALEAQADKLARALREAAEGFKSR